MEQAAEPRGTAEQRLRPIERIQTSREFRRVFEKGRVFGTRILRIHYLPTSREYGRVGLVVSRRHGKAHVRTRLKRWLREVYRRLKSELRGSHDIILLPRPSLEASYASYQRAFRDFLAHLAAPPKGRSRRPGGTAPRRRKVGRKSSPERSA